jgi:hypothetical protein
MKAADNRNACVPESPGKVIGAKDKIPWAFDGTEEAEQWPMEKRQVSQCPYLGKKVAVLFLAEATRVFSAFGCYAFDLRLHTFSSKRPLMPSI